MHWGHTLLHDTHTLESHFWTFFSNSFNTSVESMQYFTLLILNYGRPLPWIIFLFCFCSTGRTVNLHEGCPLPTVMELEINLVLILSSMLWKDCGCLYQLNNRWLLIISLTEEIIKQVHLIHKMATSFLLSKVHVTVLRCPMKVTRDISCVFTICSSSAAKYQSIDKWGNVVVWRAPSSPSWVWCISDPKLDCLVCC